MKQLSIQIIIIIIKIPFLSKISLKILFFINMYKNKLSFGLPNFYFRIAWILLEGIYHFRYLF